MYPNERLLRREYDARAQRDDASLAALLTEAVVCGDRHVSFFLEYDRGTENHAQLDMKMELYRLVMGYGFNPEALLFVFPSFARERAVRRSILGPRFALVTGVRDQVLHDPLGPVWLPLDQDRRRLFFDLPLEPRDKPG